MSECHILTEVDIKCRILSTLILYLGKGKKYCVFFLEFQVGGGVLLCLLLFIQVLNYNIKYIYTIYIKYMFIIVYFKFLL